MFPIAQTDRSRRKNVVSMSRGRVPRRFFTPRFRFGLMWVAALTLVLSVAESTARAQPVAVNDTDNVDYETDLDIDVLLNDTEGEDPIDPTTVAIVIQPTNGSVSVDADSGEITYTPDPKFVGTDSFQYTVDDEAAATSNAGTVSITVDEPGAPEIVLFEVTEDCADVWFFTGEVDHIYAEDLTVEFGGLLEGHSVAVDTDGSFSYSVVLTSGGLVTATTTDEFGQESNEVSDEVF